MLKNYEKLFEQLDAPEPPAELAAVILAAVARREQRLRRVKIVVVSTAFTCSIALGIEGLLAFSGQLSQSGFLDFASLFFSDFSLAISNLPDFAMSVAESFPAMSAAVILGSGMIALWSGSALFDETIMVRKQRTLA